MGQWTTATVILDDSSIDAPPTDLLTQVRAQPNALVYSAVVERSAPPKLYLKVRGNQPGLRDTLLDYCTPVRDTVAGVYIASINNTSDDVWIGYHEPADGVTIGDHAFRLVEQAEGTLDLQVTGADSDAPSHVVRPTGSAFTTTDLCAYFREQYGVEPLLRYRDA